MLKYQFKMGPEERFKINTVSLVDYMLSLDVDLPATHLKIVKGFILGSEPDKLIELFIKHSRHIWNQIKDSDEKYFISNSKVIFAIFSKDKIDAIVDLIMSDSINSNSKVVIWKYFASFVRISINYLLEHDSLNEHVREEARIWKIRVKD
uniref:Uncharacterized protein n=1 Tax=Pithovirus LCPAC401 TaxID=2506595 RepID=A0A481Z9Y1_9VIRU|nr:MAG: uncharacterized protein LCPAC401_03460 [Pithovirus LCPAC401]